MNYFAILTHKLSDQSLTHKRSDQGKEIVKPHLRPWRNRQKTDDNPRLSLYDCRAGGKFTEGWTDFAPKGGNLR
jgi:hypothetical protein